MSSRLHRTDRWCGIGRVAYLARDEPSTPSKILQAGLGIQTDTFFVLLTILSWTLWKSRRSSVRVSRVFMSLFVIARLAVYLRTCSAWLKPGASCSRGVRCRTIL